MPGLTYGGSAGGTYGGDAGGLYGHPDPFWRLDGTPLVTRTAESATWQTLRLTLRTDDELRDDVLAPLESAAGKLSVITADDGSYTTIDRSTSGNTVHVVPPSSRDPLRVEDDYLVDAYAERVTDQAGGVYEVTLRLTPDADREPSGTSVSQSRASDEWSFEFRSGTVATKRVRHDIGAGSETGVGGKQLLLILDNDQAKVVEESVSRLAAVSTREVPDGDNVVDDNAPNDENTVTVTPPDGQSDVFASGDYVVEAWQTTRLTDGQNRVELELSKA